MQLANVAANLATPALVSPLTAALQQVHGVLVPLIAAEGKLPNIVKKAQTCLAISMDWYSNQ